MMSDDDDDCGCRDRNEERKSFLLISCFSSFLRSRSFFFFFLEFSQFDQKYITNNAKMGR